MLVTPASGLVSAASAETGTIDTSSAPKVLPALREWTGASGTFSVDGTVKLINAENGWDGVLAGAAHGAWKGAVQGAQDGLKNKFYDDIQFTQR